MNAIKYDFLSLPQKTIAQKYYLQTINNRRLSHVYHSHDFYELIFILEGEAVQVINNTSYKMLKGDCALLSLTDTHKFAHQSKDLELLGISVKTEEFERFAQAFEIKIRKSANPIFSAKSKIGTIKALAENPNINLADCRLLLSALLADYSLSNTGDVNIVPSNLLNAINVFSIKENISKSLDFFVRLSGYSYPHLYRLMKKHYSKTPHEFIATLKLEQAYKKICYSDMALEDVIEFVGYKSSSHFHSIFKKKYGVSPTALRSSINKTNTL